MFKYQFVLVAFTALSATPGITLAADTAANTADPAASSCQVAQLAEIRTEFPQASQSRGEHGNVVVKVTIDKEGRATHAQVTQSSGYPALDKAATGSISKHWRFDVTRCAPAALPAVSSVTVQFQRAPQFTVSGTVNTNHREVASEPASRCDSTVSVSGDRIVACIAASLANSNSQQALANRSDASKQK
jgi:TonB family protein